MKNSFLVLFILFNCSHFFAQFNFDFNDSIPVKYGSNQLIFPWAGGLNYVQVSDIDIDFDGDLDLFIFDRSKDNIRMLRQVKENQVSHYELIHGASKFFPPDLKSRVELVDYNNDGKKDIFTYGIGGVKVYKNTGNATTGIAWEVVTELIYSDYNGNHSNLYISSSDIPAYVDVDIDGDIDILTFDISGERLEYHQNQSRELYGNSDSLIFVLKNQCWGKFVEDAITSVIYLNASNTPCTSGNVPNPELIQNDSTFVLQNPKRHAGSTILAFDYNDSGVLDLLIGDVNSNALSLLINGGTQVNSNSAMISLTPNFPNNTTPVNVSIFPAAFYVDVDFDQVKDLIVAPSARNISQNEKSIYYYKNLGTNTKPNFSFRTKSFLQENMIENGTGSVPVFVDENGDDLQDLFVSNFYRYKEPMSRESNVQYYRNTGSISNPIFTYITSDFSNLIVKDLGLRLIPTFGDIDGDGDQDMFLGMENGTISYFENSAGAGNPISLSSPVNNFKDNTNTLISAQNYSFPQLFDLNKDGLLDLIIGKKTGELIYFENVGSSSNPSFELKNQVLGGIDIATINSDGYAAPHFFTYKDTIRLLLGGFDGKIRFYDQIEPNLGIGQEFNLISDNYLGINVEYLSSCWVNDIDNDGNLDLFVGGDLGGIMHLEHNINGSLDVKKLNIKNENLIKIYPNPATNKLNIETNLTDFSIQIFSNLGLNVLNSINSKTIDISELSPGIYFIKMYSNSKGFFSQEKLIISR